MRRLVHEEGEVTRRIRVIDVRFGSLVSAAYQGMGYSMGLGVMELG